MRQHAVRRLLGQGGPPETIAKGSQAIGLTRAAELSQGPLLAEELLGQSICSPRGGWTRTCSRSTCADETRGGY